MICLNVSRVELHTWATWSSHDAMVYCLSCRPITVKETGAESEERASHFFVSLHLAGSQNGKISRGCSIGYWGMQALPTSTGAIYPTQVARYGPIHPTEHSRMIRYELDTGTVHFSKFGTTKKLGYRYAEYPHPWKTKCRPWLYNTEPTAAYTTTALQDTCKLKEHGI